MKTLTTRRVRVSLLVALLASCATTMSVVAERSACSGVAPKPVVAPRVKWGDIPLSFEPNVGQEPSEVRYLARGSSYTFYLAGTEMLLTGRDTSTLRMKVLGAKGAPRITGENQQVSVSNYLIGNDPGKWHSRVANYAKARYREIYPGIDLLFYGHDGQLEYDWIVSPAADPTQIHVRFDGADGLVIDKQGDLVVSVGKAEYRHRKPVVYQQVAGKRVEIAGTWSLHGKDAGFTIGSYDHQQPLTIDPALFYATYQGGSGDDLAFGIAVDPQGNTYVTGGTGSTNFPTKNPRQATLHGAEDVFVTKINANGSGRVYSTYLGGGGQDEGRGIAVDATGNVYVTGSAGSFDFPTATAIQPTWGGSGDAFLTKLDRTGSTLVYSTYLGGNAIDYGTAIALDASGTAYIVGVTFSTNLPTVNPFQATKGLQQDAFVAKINPAGNAWVYVTYLGGNSVDEGYAIATDSAGNAYVTGYTQSTNFPTQSPFQSTNTLGSVDAFVTKINPAGSALVYSTYLGGGGTDYGSGIAVDPSGSAYVTGQTASDDFPLMNPFDNLLGSHAVSDVFVTKFTPSGSDLIYSTYVGGGGEDDGYAIAVDTAGNAWVTGRTNSSDFPLVNPIQITRVAFDTFVTEVNANGSALLFSTFVGGSGSEAGRGIAIDVLGNVHVAGETSSTDFRVVNGVQMAYGGGLHDAFVLQFGSRLPYVFNDFDGNHCSDGEFIYDAATGQSNTTLSSGDGTYSYVPSSVSSGFNILRQGDFNGDGKADVLLFKSSDGSALIGLGNGDGTFSFQPLFLSPGYSPGYDFVETGDMNGDGKTDIFLFSTQVSGMDIALSNGDGTFSDHLVGIVVGWDYVHLVDFMGDGRASFALYNSSTGDMWFIQGIFNIDSPVEVVYQALPGPGYDQIDFGDLNGDGLADAILYNSTTGSATTLIGDGLGHFALTPLLLTPGFTSVRLADFTGDGRADLTVYDKNTAVAFFGTGTGDGNFTFQTLFWSPGYDWVVPEDVNCDGKLDVILYNSATGTQYTGLSNGDGTFSYMYSDWSAGKTLVDENTHVSAPLVPVAPQITWPNPADITSGTPLGPAQLNATADVPGTFVYSPTAGTLLPVGNNQTLSVTFFPTDGIHYTSATASVAINVLPAGPVCASDVTTQVTITRGGFVFNPGTGRFSQAVRLTNPGAAIAGPVAFVLDNVSSNATLFNATGATSCTSPNGSPYIDVAPSGLATGGSVTVTLQFTDPTRTAITYTPRILAGSGSR